MDNYSTNLIGLTSLLHGTSGMNKEASALKLLKKLRPSGWRANLADPVSEYSAKLIDSHIALDDIPGSVLQPGTRNILANSSPASASSLADRVMGKLTAERISNSLVDNWGKYPEPNWALKRGILDKLDAIVNSRLDRAVKEKTPELWSRFSTAANTRDALGGINDFGVIN